MKSLLEIWRLESFDYLEDVFRFINHFYASTNSMYHTGITV